MDTFRGDNCQNCSYPFWKVVYTNMKEYAPFGNILSVWGVNSFPLKLTYFYAPQQKVASYVILSETLSIRLPVRQGFIISCPLDNSWYRLRYFQENSHQCKAICRVFPQKFI